MKSCDGCTKCCEGYLPAVINGHEMYPGKPCFFVEINVGCKIYADRPEQPCKNYECFWKKEEAVPEHLKPSKTGMIIGITRETGYKELMLIPAGGYSEDLVDWLAEYAKQNNLNTYWVKDEKQHFTGDPEYIARRKKLNNYNG